MDNISVQYLFDSTHLSKNISRQKEDVVAGYSQKEVAFF